MQFELNAQARISGKLTDGTNLAYTGITTADSLTPNNAAVQLNKILGIGGKSIVADSNMKRTLTEEAKDE